MAQFYLVAFIRKFLILFFDVYLSLIELVHLKDQVPWVKIVKVSLGQMFVKKPNNSDEVSTSTTFSISGQISDQTLRSIFQVLSQEA